MNLVVLHYYRTVCRAGSIAKAAEQLSLSRQALSKSILALEDEVGLKLFSRKSSGIELTPAGEILCRHAGLLRQGWEDAMEMQCGPGLGGHNGDAVWSRAGRS